MNLKQGQEVRDAQDPNRIGIVVGTGSSLGARVLWCWDESLTWTSERPVVAAGVTLWMRVPMYSKLNDYALYIDGRPVGWIEEEETTTNGARDPLLPEVTEIIDGVPSTSHRRGWYGWQVGLTDGTLAAGVAPTRDAAKDCVVMVARLCGFAGFDTETGDAVWLPSDTTPPTT